MVIPFFNNVIFKTLLDPHIFSSSLFANSGSKEKFVWKRVHLIKDLPKNDLPEKEHNDALDAPKYVGCLLLNAERAMKFSRIGCPPWRSGFFPITIIHDDNSEIKADFSYHGKTGFWTGMKKRNELYSSLRFRFIVLHNRFPK